VLGRLVVGGCVSGVGFVVCTLSMCRDENVFDGRRRSSWVGRRRGRVERVGRRGGCCRLKRWVLGGGCCLYNAVAVLATGRDTRLWLKTGHLDMGVMWLGRLDMARRQELVKVAQAAVLRSLSCPKTV
jgi:hypothetical protein